MRNMKEYIVASSFDAENPPETLIISCHTVYRELEAAMEKTGQRYPLIYLRSDLHDVPKNLNGSLQQLIDEASDRGVKRILLGYATCGNSVAGLNTRNCQVILPKLDDCATFFLGSLKRRREMPSGTYFLTHGWLYDEGHGRAFYDAIMEKYGEEDGEEIFDMLMENYKHVGLIDTHCYDIEKMIEDAKEYAALLDKELIMIDGSNDYLEQLICGPWPEDKFLVFEAGHVIRAEELYLG